MGWRRPFFFQLLPSPCLWEVAPARAGRILILVKKKTSVKGKESQKSFLVSDQVSIIIIVIACTEYFHLQFSHIIYHCTGTTITAYYYNYFIAVIVATVLRNSPHITKYLFLR